MALTLQVEQQLEAIGLVKLFDDHRADWLTFAKDSYAYIESNFPEGSAPRRDDVAKTFLPIIEVNERLKNFLGTKKATQKYWFKNFTDLIIDRVWDQITG